MSRPNFTPLIKTSMRTWKTITIGLIAATLLFFSSCGADTTRSVEDEITGGTYSGPAGDTGGTGGQDTAGQGAIDQGAAGQNIPAQGTGGLDTTGSGGQIDTGIPDSGIVTLCGNGVIDQNEECDGTNLAGASCATLNNTIGTLSCSQSCSYDLSMCQEDNSATGGYGDIGGTGGTEPSGGSGGAGGTSDTGGTGGSSGTLPSCEVSAIPDDIRSNLRIDPFYQKYASANGVIIATSPLVGDDAITRNCHLLSEMYSNETLRQAIISQGMWFTMIAQSEQLSSLPEISSRYGTLYDLRARGLGSMVPTICAEDSIMCMPGDPWRGDCICPHEYGHTLADWAIGRGDPAMAARLSQITNDIRASGRLANAYVWQDGGTSGMIAYGVQVWYNCAVNGTVGGYHSDINTREEMQRELPDLYDFLAEILPEDNQYVDCYSN